MTDMNSANDTVRTLEAASRPRGWPYGPIVIPCTTAAPMEGKVENGTVTVTVTPPGIIESHTPGTVTIMASSGIERGSERNVSIDVTGDREPAAGPLYGMGDGPITIDSRVTVQSTSQKGIEAFSKVWLTGEINAAGFHSGGYVKTSTDDISILPMHGEHYVPRLKFPQSQIKGGPVRVPINVDVPTYPDGGEIGSGRIKVDICPFALGDEVSVHDRPDRGRINKILAAALPPAVGVEFDDGSASFYDMTDVTHTATEGEISSADENGCFTTGDGDCISDGPCIHTPPFDPSVDYDMTPDRAITLNIRTRAFHHILAGLDALLRIEPAGVGFVATDHGHSPSMTHAEIDDLIEDLVVQADENPLQIRQGRIDRVQYLLDEIRAHGGVVDHRTRVVSWPVKKAAKTFVPTERDIWLAENGKAICDVLPYAQAYLDMNRDINRNHDRDIARVDRIREIVDRHRAIVNEHRASAEPV